MIAVDLIYNRFQPTNELSESVSIPVQPGTLPPVHLLTYGGGRDEYRSAAMQLSADAADTGWFQSITCVTDLQDSELTQALHEVHGKFIQRNPRGNGYWIWKPFLSLELLKNLPKGHILAYLDSGCELSIIGHSIWNHFVRQAAQHGSLFFSLPYIEAEWTKQETLSAMGLSGEHLESMQIQATWFMLRVDDESLELLGRWHEFCQKDDYALLIDTRNATIQSPMFHEHRHDQSILSILVKQRNIRTFPWLDRFAPWLYIKNSWTLLYPVHTTRATKDRKIAKLAIRSNTLACAANATTPSFLESAEMSLYKAYYLSRSIVAAWTSKLL